MNICFIIPIYNTEKTKIVRCIQSIIGISNVSFSCNALIVDDGSDNDTYRVCDELCEQYDNVRCIHQKNKGASAARNTGIDNAIGDFIFFVDADDVVDTNSLNRLIVNDVDITFTDISVKRNGGVDVWRAFENEGPVNVSDVVRRITVDGKLNGPVGKLIRLEFIKDNDIRFRDGIVTGEDALFLLDMIRNNPTMYYLNVSTYLYYLDVSTSIKRLLSEAKVVIRDNWLVYKEIHELIEIVIRNEGEKKLLLSNNSQKTVKQFFNNCGELILNGRFSNCKVYFEKKVSEIISDTQEWPIKAKIQYFCLKNRYYFLIGIIAIVRRVYLRLKNV